MRTYRPWRKPQPLLLRYHFQLNMEKVTQLVKSQIYIGNFLLIGRDQRNRHCSDAA